MRKTITIDSLEQFTGAGLGSMYYTACKAGAAGVFIWKSSAIKPAAVKGTWDEN